MQKTIVIPGAAGPLETGAPELSAFDVAAVRHQTYWTGGGEGILILRIEDQDGRSIFSASLFGATNDLALRPPPRIETSTYADRRLRRRADVTPLAGDCGIQRYLIVGDSEAAV